MLGEFGIEVRETSDEPDAADKALIKAGLREVRNGAVELVVVSCDHAFADLAPHVRLCVIYRDCSPLSSRLAACAHTVKAVSAA